MPHITIGFGIALIILGIGGYFGTDRASMTALIPAFFGVALLLSGFVARRDHLRKHAMHAAVLVGLAGVIGALVRPAKTLFSSERFEFTTSVALQLTMAVLCAVFVGLCIRSFVQAKRARNKS